MTFEELHRSRVRGLRGRGLRLEQGPHERPPAGGRGRPGAPEGSGPGLGAGAGGLRRAADQEGAHRRDRVVGDFARPDQVPEGGEHDPFVGDACRGQQLGPEARASFSQVVADRVVDRARRRGFGERRRDEPERLAEPERDPSVVGADPAGAHPHDVAARAQRIEIGRAVARTRDRRTSDSTIEAGIEAPCSCAIASMSAVGPCRGPVAACHSGTNLPSAGASTGSTSLRSAASERRRIDRSTSASHHSRSRPPGRNSPRTTRPCASSEATAPATRSSPMPNRAATSAIPNGPWVLANRATSPSSGGRRLREDAGDAERERRAERVPVAARVLDRDVPVLPPDPQADRAPIEFEIVEPPGRIRVRPRRHLLGAQVSEPPEQVVHVVGVASAAALGLVLQLELELGERDRVDQLAQVLRAEELAQELPIERERGGTPLGHRCVRLVHVDRDPAEQQGLRERRRPRGVDRDHVDAPRPDAGEHLPQPGTSNTSRRTSRVASSRIGNVG